MKIKDIHFAEYKVETLYCLQRKHELMGFFPLIEKEGKKRIILSDSKDVLKELWEILPPREVIVRELNCFVNRKGGIVVPMTQNFDADSDNYLFVTDATKVECDYAPGLLSLHDESAATFPD